MSAEPDVTLQQLDAEAAQAAIEPLCDLLLDCVDGGASVGFLAPLSRAKALAFWGKVVQGVADGERWLLVARNRQGRIDGTVQVLPAGMENQPHRAEISKLLVHRRARQAGLGAALMRAAEALASQRGRRVLVLDTATPEAERLYRREGWQFCGSVPDYALMPDGALCATSFYYKLTSPAT